MKRIVTAKALINVQHVDDVSIQGMEMIFAFKIDNTVGPKILMLKRRKDIFNWVTLNVGYEWGLHYGTLAECVRSAVERNFEIILFESMREAIKYCDNFLNKEK